MAAVVLFLLIAGSFVPFVDIIAQVTLLVFIWQPFNLRFVYA